MPRRYVSNAPTNQAPGHGGRRLVLLDPAKNDHIAEACQDPSCPRFPCRIWKEAYRLGYDDGYRDGYDEGWEDGYAAGQAAGYAAGYAAGLSAGLATCAG